MNDKGEMMANPSSAALVQWTTQAAFARGQGIEAAYLLDSLEGLTPEQAAWSPPEGAASIWEIVNHVAFWKDVVLKTLRGDAESLDEPWPPIEAVSREGWISAIAHLEALHAELEEHVGRMTDEDLVEVPSYEGAQSWGKTLIGLAAHDCYHTGQIVKLRQMQGIWPFPR
jgi:uncharacterized damage-inducible protein DinB